MIIRKMQISDIENVKKVAIKSWHNTYEGIIPRKIQDSFLSVAYANDTLKNRLDQTPFYVAEKDRSILGFANFTSVQKNGETELLAIYLDPDFQNKGIGTLLLKYGIDNLSPKKIFINVEAENQIGLQFYKAKNFKIIEEFEENFDGHYLKTVRMVLEIN